MLNSVDKILNLDNLKSKVEELKKLDKKIVFTNGCFDILHRGHIDYLEKAKAKGDYLIVAVNSDNSVKSLGKSNSRPIQDETSRALIIASLMFVDFVLIFDEHTPLILIQELLPNILVKGADYKPENIVGYKEVIDNGGKVETINFLEGFSTTLIEKKIKES